MTIPVLVAVSQATYGRRVVVEEVGVLFSEIEAAAAAVAASGSAGAR
jgi:hypothetical protein